MQDSPKHSPSNHRSSTTQLDHSLDSNDTLGFHLETAEIASRQQKLQRKASIARYFFLVAFAIITLTLLPVMAIILFGIFSDSQSVALSWAEKLSVVSDFVGMLAMPLMLFTLAGFFKDIASSESPINTKQSKRLVLIGSLLIASVLIGLLSQVAFSDYSITTVAQENIVIGMYSPSPETKYFFIDFQSLFGAVFCYCLSFVFKYATYLQNLSDDTI